MEFAIVDIETTGGSPQTGGITEIAVLIHDGESVIREYQTLLNPQQGIPTYITGLTGIDNFMVRHAPTFAEVHQELWELLSHRVFVAHQVNFDFGFMREAFLRHGLDFKAPKLCTVRLSRKAIPGLSSYSLGRICENQRIPITQRHRAMGDARATAELFDRIIKSHPDVVSGSLKRNSGEAFLPPNFPKSKFREIPDACGVYYMLNDKGKIIYVGKATNIRERFKNHFSGQVLPNLKAKLKAEVTDLRWQLTGTEFMALLIETVEIRRLWPCYNAAQKIPKTLWGLFHYEDNAGYGRFQLAKVTRHLRPLESFFSLDEATSFLKSGIETYGLCPKLCGQRKIPCAEASGSRCSGACTSGEAPGEYNRRVDLFRERIRESQKEVLIRMPGRNAGESAFCLFDRGILSKYGFLEGEIDGADIVSQLQEVAKVPETFYILRQYIHQLDSRQIRVLESI